jgi:hypothetical protein
MKVRVKFWIDGRKKEEMKKSGKWKEGMRVISRVREGK